MTERRFSLPRSLSAKLLLATLLSLLCALAAYLAVYWAADAAVDRYYMSASAVAERKAAIYTDLNRFVTAGNVAGNDAEAMQRFLLEKTYVSVTVYTPEELGLPAGLEPIQVFREAGPVGGSLYVAVRKPAGQNLVLSGRDEMNGKLYPMRFSDGIYYIAITDNSRAREDMLNRGMAGVMATVVLVAVLFWYTSRLTRRIIRLSHETAAVGAGDLNADITVDGRDEIAGLASDIDGMRDAIIERMGNEKRAWEANSELITAMSHDIRTPMTSLLGYLGLLNNGRPLPEDEQKRYLEAAYGKSLALKELTDELFKYFLVFGHSDVELHREVFDAHLLLMQLLGEAQFDLQDAGYGVQNIDRLEDGVTLDTDAAMLKRVLDNLVSNIKKYADRELPVVFLTEKKDDGVTVTVSNGVSGRRGGTESTKIGLRTCEKILSALGGTFSTSRDEAHFAAEFTLPVKTE